MVTGLRVHKTVLAIQEDVAGIHEDVGGIQEDVAVCNSAIFISIPSSFFNRNYSWNGSKFRMLPTISANWRVNSDSCYAVQSARQEPASVY